MAVLLDNGTIQYNSLDELRGAVDCLLSNSGFLFESQSDWPLRTLIDFTIRVAGRNFTTSVRAEVVYCQGGQIGIDFHNREATRTALAVLDERLSTSTAEGVIDPDGDRGRTAEETPVAAAYVQTSQAEIRPAAPEYPAAPVLLEDCSLRYHSPDAYIADYEQHIGKGLMFLDSPHSWGRGETLQLSIFVEGISTSASILAEVLVCDNGKVGLDIRNNLAADKALADLLDRSKKLADNPPATGDKTPPGSEKTQSLPTGEAVSRKEQADRPVRGKPATTAQTLVGEIAGRIVPGDGIAHLRSMDPLAISDERLRSVDLFCLISSLSSGGLSLDLLVDLSGKALRFGFNDKGNIVHFKAPGVQEDLLDRLIKKQLIPRSRKRPLLDETSATKPVEVVLMEQKVIKLRELWTCMRDQVVDTLEEIRHAGTSPYAVCTLKTTRRTGVAFNRLIMPWLDRALSELDPERIDELLEPFTNRYPLPKKDCRWPFSDLALDRKSREFIEKQLDGTRTLADAINFVPLVQRKKRRLQAAALNSIGALELLSDSLASEDQKPEYKLSNELAVLTEANKFEQAGVHWSAHPTTYRETLQKVKRNYGPGSTLAVQSPETADLCRKRIAMAEKAIEYLDNRDRRMQCRKEVIESSQRKIAAELLFRQVEILLFKNDNSRAKLDLEMAVELNPKPEYVQKLNQIK